MKLNIIRALSGKTRDSRAIRSTFKPIIQNPVCPVLYPVSVSLIFTKNSAKMQFSLVVGGTSEKNVLISRFDL